jgi:small-conductance mechanosensitive channel
LVISNEHDGDRIRKIITEIVEADKRVVNYPASPSIICTKTDGGSYTLQVRFFTREADNSPALSEIMESVNKELAKRNIGGPVARMIVYQD